MRQQINDNPVVQVALIAVLLVAAGFFVLGSSGGGEGGESEAEATVAIAGDEPGVTQAGSVSLSEALVGLGAAAPPPPRNVVEAWRDGRTLVLLFIRDGGIDDRLVRIATADLTGLPDVAVFVVPAARIYRYAAITRGLGVDRVPALVVVSPKSLPGRVPSASVSYGFQSRESIVQAVVDAGYEGPVREYHP